jgi:hypothetical protein
MDAMMVVEPEHSAQAPQAHNEPNEELALWRQLLGIIRDAEWQIGWGPVFLQPPETRTHLWERVNHLQAQFDINHRMPTVLHACAVVLHRGLQMRITQSSLMRLLRVAREMCRIHHPDYRLTANLHDVFFCLRDVSEWASYTPEETSQTDLRQMLCVLPESRAAVSASEALQPPEKP